MKSKKLRDSEFYRLSASFIYFDAEGRGLLESCRRTAGERPEVGQRKLTVELNVIQYNSQYIEKMLLTD